MKVVITGLDQLKAKIDKMIVNATPEIERATRKALLYMHGQLPPYPAPRPGQTYTRTGTLGRKITTEVRTLSASEVQGLIGTNVKYAPWVISNAAIGKVGPQAWMHKGRWWTLQEEVAKQRSKMIEIYKDAVHRMVR